MFFRDATGNAYFMERLVMMERKRDFGMRDIPVFTTENGVASLTLREIPYRKIAYVKFQATQEPEGFLKECIGFSRACGAETVFATGHSCLEAFPLWATILEMTVSKGSLPNSEAMLFPVLPETVGQWRSIYNQKVQKIPNGAYMTEKEEKELVSCGDGYFVHKDGVLLGIGRASGDRIDFIAGVQPGAGQEVLATLASLLSEDRVRLEVAAENQKAMDLYQRLGFIASKEISRWYRVFGQEEKTDG